MNKKFKCDICNKMLSRKQNLIKHRDNIVKCKPRAPIITGSMIKEGKTLEQKINSFKNTTEKIENIPERPVLTREITENIGYLPERQVLTREITENIGDLPERPVLTREITEKIEDIDLYFNKANKVLEFINKNHNEINNLYNLIKNV